MGRATRWFKSFFGFKKTTVSGDRRDNLPACIGFPRTTTSPPEKPTYPIDSEDEQNHTIAVAAATAAAAADAAVAAAQAAVAVVRLTSQGVFSGGDRESLAAIKIQSMFRGYLSRKALRALRGLVKVQALVRGYLVRKQAAATLRSMEAMVRAQSSICAHNYHHAINKFQDSKERIDESRTKHTTSSHSKRLAAFDTSLIEESPKIVEIDPGRPNSRSRRTNTWDWAPGYIDNPNAQTFTSPIRHRSPARLPIPSSQSREFEWAPHIRPNQGRPVSPSKSVCTDGSSSTHRSYMANTKSFNAKLRSQSAPRHRPEFGFGHKKKVSLNEMMESRNSVSYGVKMQRSSSQAQEAYSYNNAIMDRFGGYYDVRW